MELIPVTVLRAFPYSFREERFERGDRGAPDADVDFDHGPGVDGYRVEEGVGGLFCGSKLVGMVRKWVELKYLGVNAHTVKSHDGCNAGESAEREDADQSELFATGAVYAHEDFDGQDKDPDVKYDVGGGCHWETVLAYPFKRSFDA